MIRPGMVKFSLVATAAYMVFYGGTALAATSYQQAVPDSIKPLVSESSYLSVLKTLDDNVPKLSEATLVKIAGSPCGNSMSRLIAFYYHTSEGRATLKMVFDGLKKPPQSAGTDNRWMKAKNAEELVWMLVDYTEEWCTALPKINGNSDDGMKYLSDMYWLYYMNDAGKYFAQGRNPAPPHAALPDNFNFLQEFATESGKFMDSQASTGTISQWVSDPRIEISDYPKQTYKSWNEFFARIITMDEQTKTIPSRPATMPLDQYPERDYIIVSPTDCIMNPLIQVLGKSDSATKSWIDNPLQLDTVLDIKHIPISVERLLGSAPADIKQKFVGGTGLSCILMPNTYHNFHAPVNGTVIHAEIVKGPTFGYDDWPNLMPSNHNPAQLGTDFSQFEVYQRGVVIIEVKYKNADGTGYLTGYVASIPVGLDTIGSVVLDDQIKPGATVKRGYSRIGNFLYGGSLNVLLFSKDLATGSVQTRLGNQIGIINVGTTPQ